ncbi:ABC transporter ATP-binding protein [Truepera radiovictrix]|uniref:ABC transporter related protein n=1 Tax=Truepera radiovictrix (strain DSM 17093 / CIP 108686 / LMG 22925 / RQ-24) TaxID=649638 RepID=D7CS82_TRURR|nr:ABC transporter ATP-binding protein [Truepera radiovictrix]ADI13614.1 ABC transporter related protein [Truepera radiovictrix DSM 17093]WMT57824.1 ABC transporter ATP-binding protein [Truepera radiovictrix]
MERRKSLPLQASESAFKGISEPLIAASELHKSFPPRKAVLKGVDLTLYAGEVVGLLGLNGAGKTTLIKLLTGLLEPDAGSVTLLGRARDRQGVRRHVALMKEGQPTLFEFMTPRQNLRYYGGLLGVRDLAAGVARVLAEVELTEVADTPLLYLSNGTKRRVGLALAYLKGARVLLLDEPSAGLDIRSTALMKGALKAFAAAGNAVLLTGHEMGFLESVCDRVVVLHGGRVAAEGTLRALLQRFAPEQWVEVWLEGRPGAGELLEEQGGLFRVRLPLAELGALGALRVRQLRLETPALEALLREVGDVARRVA